MPLNLAILTSEYPPHTAGEMGHHIQRLAEGLSMLDVDISVVTPHDAPYVSEKVSDNLQIHHIESQVKDHVSVVTRALFLSSEAQRVLADVSYESSRGLNMVDVHEWHFVAAAVGLKRALGVPFVLTLHSLEDHRSSDPNSPLNSSIRGLEWLGAYECSAIITKSDWMKGEIGRVHRVPPSKIRVVGPDSPSWVKEIAGAYRENLSSAPP